MMKWTNLNILKYRAILDEHRKQCEMEGKYVGKYSFRRTILFLFKLTLNTEFYIIEAEMAKNRIEELKS
jgi:hypothetical protein